MVTRLCKYLLPIGFLLTLTACSESVDELLMQAEQQRADGRYPSASVYYRSILEREPDHAEARAGLGEVALRTGDYAGAISALRRAANQGVSADRINPSLARAMLWEGEYEALLTELTPETVEPAEKRAELLALRSLAYLQQDQIEQARRAADAALDADSENRLAHVAKGRLALQAGDLDRAADAAAWILEMTEESGAGWLLKAQLSRQRGDLDAAVEAFDRLMEIPPTDISVREHFFARGQLVESLLTLDRKEEAREHIAQMLEQGARHPYPNYLAAVVAYQADEVGNAVDHLQTALSAAPNNLQAKELLGLIRVEREQYAQAVNLLQDVVSAQPANIRARIFLASAQRGLGNTPQATRTLRDGLTYADGDAAAVGALVDALNGDVDELSSLLGSLDGSDETVRRTRLAAAESLVGRGETDVAIDLLRELEAEGDDELARRQFLTIATVRSGDMESALSEARSVVDDYPDDAASHNLLGGVQLMAQRFDEARASFERAAELDPDSAQAYFNLGLLAGAEQDFDRAIRYFEQGLEIEPGNATVMVQLSDLLRRQGNQEQALEWAERAAQTAPDDSRALMVLARQQLVLGDTESAIQTAERIVSIAPENGAAHGVLGVARLESGNPDDALEPLRTAHELLPDDPDIHFQLARAKAALEDGEGTRATLNSLLDQHPDRLDARTVLTRLDLQEERTEQALDGALRLQESSESFSEGLLLEGHARNMMGDYEGAMRAYQSAANEGRLDAMGPLVNVRTELGKEHPAAPLEEWIVANPDNAQARFALANWYIEREHFESAVVHYEALRELTEAQNPVVLNNLAWLYQQLDDDRARSTAERALELAPESPDILDTLGWIHLANGDHETALPYLQRASAGAPENAQIQYHYGRALHKAEDPDAAGVLQRAIDLAPESDWADEARQLLDASGADAAPAR